MRATPSIRTVDLARAAGISVQQVRNYEVGGFIPPVERSPSGYRRYTRRHLVALQTARALVAGYGVGRAQEIMRAAHAGNIGEALAIIDARHADLDRTRRQLAATLTALNVLAAQLPTAVAARRPQGLRVGAAARLVGVRVSAVRFWEEQGLLRPARDPDSRYRLYDEGQLRRLRIVALLRQAHYDFGAIRTTLDELESGQPQRAIAAIEHRRDELARISWGCLAALAAFHAYVGEALPDVVASLGAPAATGWAVRLAVAGQALEPLGAGADDQPGGTADTDRSASEVPRTSMRSGE
jgi:DNA-binding transcriptional MerR regulator